MSQAVRCAAALTSEGSPGEKQGIKVTLCQLPWAGIIPSILQTKTRRAWA